MRAASAILRPIDSSFDCLNCRICSLSPTGSHPIRSPFLMTTCHVYVYCCFILCALAPYSLSSISILLPESVFRRACHCLRGNLRIFDYRPSLTPGRTSALRALRLNRILSVICSSLSDLCPFVQRSKLLVLFSNRCGLLPCCRSAKCHCFDRQVIPPCS